MANKTACERLKGRVVYVVDAASDRLILEAYSEGMPGPQQDIFRVVAAHDPSSSYAYLVFEELKAK